MSVGYKFEVRIPPARFDVKKREAGTTADSADMEMRGVKIRYDYDPRSHTLGVEVMDKPFLVSMAYVEAEIKKWLAS